LHVSRETCGQVVLCGDRAHLGWAVGIEWLDG